jgi:hypothetical protein
MHKESWRRPSITQNAKARIYWTIFVEGIATKQRYLQQLQNDVIQVTQGSRHVNATYLQQDSAHPHASNVVLDVLHDAE